MDVELGVRPVDAVLTNEDYYFVGRLVRFIIVLAKMQLFVDAEQAKGNKQLRSALEELGQVQLDLDCCWSTREGRLRVARACLGALKTIGMPFVVRVADEQIHEALVRDAEKGF